MGGGAAILKQATAAGRTGPERNPADYPGIKVIYQTGILRIRNSLLTFKIYRQETPGKLCLEKMGFFL